MTQRTESVDVFGDSIEIHYDGNMWVSPHNGQQHSDASDAMRSELAAYYLASGDDPDSPEIAAEIEAYASQV